MSVLKKSDIKELPKVELHLHLDCSLSYSVVKKINPQITKESYRSDFIAPGKCTNLNEYIDKATSSIELMQTIEHLTWVTHDLYNQLIADNILYAEIRFAPLLHTKEGLTPEQVVECVINASDQAKRNSGIKGGIILCTLRHYSQQQSLETIHLVEKYLDQGVVGFDIASDEAGYPIDNHIRAFQYAKQKGIPCTAHAGEAKGPESVWETIHNFFPKRIGHGVRSEEDPSLLEHLKSENIHLEICPTSNVQTNVFKDISRHNVDRLYRSGISLSINTDGKTLSDTTCTKEYCHLANHFHWTSKEFLNCNLNAIDAAFTSEEIKSEIKAKLHKAYLNQ